MSDFHKKPLQVGKLLLLFFPCLTLSQPGLAVELELFGTISTQVESVSPDTSSDQDYIGIRDGYYSRLAFKLTHKFDNGVNILALVEFPFDTANIEVQHGWDQDRDMFDSRERLAKLQADSQEYGSVWIGRGWEPYYNEISSVVDRFSSYYTGYATFSALRVDQAIVYSSPSIGGLKFNLMHSHGNGNRETKGGFDNRNQVTVSYFFGGTKLAFGFTDTGGTSNRQLYGFSLSQKMGDFHVAAKYEFHRSNVSDEAIFGHNNSHAANLYAQYRKSAHTFKGHLAEVDNFGGGIFHIGYDYQFNKSVNFFAEYYREQIGAAISTRADGYRDTFWNEGGSAVVFGVSFAFSKKL